MTPEEPVVESAPVAAAPPEPAPSPSSPPPAPEPAREAEPTVSADQFTRMVSRLESRPEGPAAPEPVPPARERPSRTPSPAVTPPAAPAAPAAEEPRRWGGRYDTPEALEEAYKRVEADKSRAEQAAQRLERLLLASLEGARPAQTAPAQPAAPPRPPTQWTQQAAHAAIREEAARLGLDDPAADPQRFIRAIAAALRDDDEARALYVTPTLHAIQQREEQQRQIQTLQNAFYTNYPDLQQVDPDLLRQVAQRTEARLYRAAPETYGSPEYVQQWFQETAREARTVLRVPSASGPEGNGAASVPSQPPPSPPKASSAKPKGAPFAESPSPRPTEPQLSGQALHLARVFGRQG
jgi:hypothetical protein